MLNVNCISVPNLSAATPLPREPSPDPTANALGSVTPPLQTSPTTLHNQDAVDFNYNVKVSNPFNPLAQAEEKLPSLAQNSPTFQQPPYTSCQPQSSPEKSDFELIRLELAKVSKVIEENQEKLLSKEWVKKEG